MSKLKKLNKLNKSKTLNVALAVGLVASNLVSVVPAFAASPASAHIMSVSNKISMTSTMVNKLDLQDVAVTITTGNPLKGIKLGSSYLEEGTDYTIADDQVTILATYLEGLSTGSKSFKFDFESGSDKTLRISISDKEASISSRYATFNNKNGKGKDISVTVKTYGLTLNQISNDGNPLDAADYEVGTPSSSGSVKVKILKEYLSTLPNETNDLTFEFAAGEAPVLPVRVSYNEESPEATIESVKAVAVTTEVGTAPELPPTVTATMSDDTTKEVAVDWADIDATKYAEAGTFEVVGTIAGTTVKANAVVTVTAVAPIAAKTVDATVNGTLTVTMNKTPLTTPVIADFTVLKDGVAVTPTAITTDGLVVTLTVPTVVATTAEQNVVYSVSYKTTDAVTGTLVVAAVTGLTVSSVSAINLKQVKVTFSNEVDKTTAETTTNYAGLTVDPTAKVVLQDDKKSVIVNLTSALTPYVDVTVTISNVKDIAGTKMESKGFTIKPEDTTVPTVTNAVAKGNRSIEIQFSEPVQNAGTVGNYKVDNVVLAGPSAVVVSSDGTKATINLASTLTVGDHKVVIFADNTADVADYAGYNVPTKELTVTVAEDTTAPTVSSVAVNNQTKVTVNFGKAVNVAEGAGDVAKFYWNTGGSATDTAKTPDGIKKVNDTTYELTFTTNPLAIGDVSFFVKDVADFNGNKIAGNVAANVYKSVVTVTADVAPKVTKLEATAEDKIVLTFDNALTLASATARANYTVTNSSGESMALSGTVAPAYDSTAKTVTLTLAAKAVGGNYTVTAKNLKSVTNVTLPDYSGTVAVTDKTAPIVSGVTATTVKAVINFNEEIATTGSYSALELANYRVKLGSADESALPSGTTIKALNSNKAVEIALPTGKTFSTNDTIKLGYIDGSTIKAIADKANNVVTPGTVVTVTSVIASGVNLNVGTTLNITSPTTLELTLPASSTALANVEANDFKIFKTAQSFATATGNLTIQSATLDSTGKKVTFTVADTVTGRFTADEAAYLYVDTAAASIDTKDQLGLKIVEGVAKTYTANKLPVGLSSVVVKDSDELTVTFDAKVQSDGTATPNQLQQLASSLIVTQGDKTYTGTTALTVTAGGVTTGVTTFNVLVNTSGVDFTGNTNAITVKTVSVDQITAKALNGALIAANTTGVQSSAFVASAITPADVTYAGAKATGNITINNNAIEVATAGNSVGTITIADDAALAALTTSQAAAALVSTVDGTAKSYTIVNTVTTKAAFLTALNGAGVLNGTGIASFDANNHLVVTSATLGAGSTVAFSGAAAAAIVGAAPVVTAGADGDTVTVNGASTAKGIVFIPNGSSAALATTTAREIVALGTTANATATALALAITDETNLDAAATENVVTVSADTAGVAGNAYTLAKSTDVDNDLTLSTATLSGGVASVSAVANTVNVGDTLTLTFNRNVDTASIVSGWDGQTAKAITNLVTFSDSTETITFAGANIGSILATNLSADSVADATIALGSDNKSLVITFTKVSTPVVVTATAITYTPDGNIKSTGGTAVDVKVKPTTTTNF